MHNLQRNSKTVGTTLAHEQHDRGEPWQAHVIHIVSDSPNSTDTDTCPPSKTDGFKSFLVNTFPDDNT